MCLSASPSYGDELPMVRGLEEAVAAGAETLEPPLDTPYGDRRAMVKDRWGNVWQIARVLHTPKRHRGGRAAK